MRVDKRVLLSWRLTLPYNRHLGRSTPDAWEASYRQMQGMQSTPYQGTLLLRRSQPKSAGESTADQGPTLARQLAQKLAIRLWHCA